jgi:HEAT repeat protein
MARSVQIKMSTRERTMIALLIALIAVLTTPMTGQNSRTAKPPWEELEKQLSHQGFKTDAASLIELANSTANASPRWMAIEILGLRGERNAIPVLREIAKRDETRLLKESSALALARLKDPDGIPLLREFARSSDNTERQIYLASQMAELGDASGYPYVSEAAHSKNAHVRYLAASTLSSFVPFELAGGKPQVQPTELLISMAGDNDPEVRKEVVFQFPLAVYKGASISKFEPVVAKMAKDDAVPEVRETSAGVLTLWSEQCRTKPSTGECK